MNDKALKKRLDAIENAVATLTVWVAQSALGVISPAEAEEILRRLNSGKEWVQKKKSPPPSPTVEASDLKSDKCEFESRGGE